MLHDGDGERIRIQRVIWLPRMGRMPIIAVDLFVEVCRGSMDDGRCDEFTDSVRNVWRGSIARDINGSAALVERGTVLLFEPRAGQCESVSDWCIERGYLD